jgi:hypothetical protein
MGLSQIYDDIIQELGDFGSYQIRQYILLIFPIVFSAAFCMSYIFAAGTLPHRFVNSNYVSYTLKLYLKSLNKYKI